MPEIGDVVAGQDVLAAWGNTIRDRSTMRYTNLAALDASEPGAPDGSLRFTDEDGLVLRVLGEWLPVPAAVGGFVPAVGGTFTGVVIFGADIHAGDIRDAGGTLRIRITDDGAMNFYDGAGVRRFNIGNASDVGIRDAADVNVFFWDESEGRIKVNRLLELVNSGSDLHFPGNFWMENDSTEWSLRSNAFADPLILIRDWQGANGQVLMPSVYDFTTTTAQNVTVLSGGELRRSTSSRRWKRAIKALKRGRKGKASQDHLLDQPLQPVEFTSDLDGDNGSRHLGFIAEDLAELDPRLATFDEEGAPDGLDLNAVVAVLAAQVNELSARVAELEG